MSYKEQGFNINQINICYQILELEPEASWEQVKLAYKELAIVWHPDRFTHNPKLQQKAQERLKRINQAYEILRAYYRKQHASASRSVAEPPLPPPPPPSQKQSTNFPNRTSTDKKTTKEATLSLNPKDINT
ncbi:J domain-containing protein [Tolypothrix sp. VBCCA 56010]|uniref:J domain-containing protein n=1 Tax=Tolypothrix sp. VBCCA 56010 TaxID=3137731 RepID=UPI003D7C7092